ncbi:hypothetical protein MIMGU_mgv1a0124281mg, partial [Erythranthe guttata]
MDRMARRSSTTTTTASSLLHLLGLLSIILLHPTTSSSAIRLQKPITTAVVVPSFREAPAFRNGGTCTSDDVIHIVMPLDGNYIRGTVAAVLSILQHSTCPENVSFHFLSVHLDPEISSLINSTFPFLKFRAYEFDPTRVRDKISKSIRQALDQPLNYARIYMADILPGDVRRVIYLDSDVVVVDDIAKLWCADLAGEVLAAPEYCHANFTSYFTERSGPTRPSPPRSRPTLLLLHTGVMVVD